VCPVQESLNWQAPNWFASNPGTSSVLSDALDVNRIPTFFSFWAGNNDALGFATSGGVGELGPADPAGPFDTQDITNPLIFEGAFNSLMDALAPPENTEIRGVVANIPAIEDRYSRGRICRF